MYELSDSTALDIERTTEKVNELKVKAVYTKVQPGHHSSSPCCKSSHPRGKCPAYRRNVITVALEIILQVQRNALLWVKSVSHVENQTILQENASQKCFPK